MNKIVLIFSLVLLLGANTAVAHFTGSNSVDGSEIRWGGSTAFSTAWNAGVADWNGLNPIDILSDTWWTIEDLTIADTSQPLLAWYGAYDPNNDYIYFNSYSTRMPSLTSSQKANIAAHELGHALGLGHHSLSNNVMDSTSFYTSIGTHDESDYDYLWN